MRGRVDLDQWSTRGIVRRIESCQTFRAKVSLIGLHRISIS